MVGLPLATWARLVTWLAVGLAIYFGYGRAGAARSRASRRRDALHAAD
ncbi:MAG TPA: amino acid permease C-terminal domain-containing protein [Gemmatimonadaceae bacterium]